MDCSTPGFTVQRLLEFATTHVHWVGDAIQLSHLCHPLLLLSSVFPSVKVFNNELALRIKWQKYWSFSFSLGPSNACSGLISFRIDWFDLLALQGTLKSLLQHYNSKASILQHSAFSMVPFSHLYMTTGKITALTIPPQVVYFLTNTTTSLLLRLDASVIFHVRFFFFSYHSCYNL